MPADELTGAELASFMNSAGRAARDASRLLGCAAPDVKAEALRAAASALRSRSGDILQANERDVSAAKERGLSRAMLDRLSLDEARVEAMAAGMEAVAAQEDPVGQVIAEWSRPNGLRIQRVRVPLGVIGIIYESRPNVTADAGALCLKSGNAAILRGGSECFHSNLAIHQALLDGLRAAGLPDDCIQVVPTPNRDAVGAMLSGLEGTIDVIIPRGGESLIARVQRDARVPVIGHLKGLCHVYVHASADPRVAESVVLNSKMRRTGICGAAETLLIDREALSTLLPPIASALREAGCELRGDEAVRSVLEGVSAAEPEDWETEYLDAVLSIRAVDGIEEAIEHIATHGSGHTESIIAKDDAVVARFFTALDSSILLHNASTQFADGGEFGMGAEIGISTGRLHARGPVGAEQLTTFKYLVRGEGQTRP